jgi:hypothetical protein
MGGEQYHQAPSPELWHDSQALFPIFAKANVVDASKVGLVAVNAQLRDSAVIQKSVDATIGFITTSVDERHHRG